VLKYSDNHEVPGGLSKLFLSGSPGTVKGIFFNSPERLSTRAGLLLGGRILLAPSDAQIFLRKVADAVWFGESVIDRDLVRKLCAPKFVLLRQIPGKRTGKTKPINLVIPCRWYLKD